MPYNSDKHGRAEYGSYVQALDDFAPVEGTNSALPLEQQRFARLVYVINSAQTIIDEYSKLVVSSSGYTYTMYSVPGSLSGDATWRVSRTDAAGTRMWADGNTNFDNIASNFASLSYTL